MTRLCLAALAVAFGACPGLVTAAPPEGKGPAAPTGAPPILAVVTKAEPTTGAVELQVIDMVPQTREVVENVTELRDGRQVVVPRKQSYTVLVPTPRVVYWRADAGQALDGHGKAVAQDKMWERVKPGEVVLHLHGFAVDPAWLKVLKPEAVVLLSLKPEAAREAPKAGKGR